MKIIGLLGKKGSGKGTVAEALASIGYVEIAFADPVYSEAAEAFGVTVESLKHRGTKETPLPALTLDACKDPNFYGVAYMYLRDARDSGNHAGWMLNPKTNGFHLSPRLLLQLWGTEYRRKSDNFYWVKQLASRVEELKSAGHDKAVISDVREPHEAAWIKRRDNGFVVKVVRENNPFEKGGTEQHSSETQVDTIAYDYVIYNSGSIDYLKRTAINADSEIF